MANGEQLKSNGDIGNEVPRWKRFAVGVALATLAFTGCSSDPDRDASETPETAIEQAADNTDLEQSNLPTFKYVKKLTGIDSDKEAQYFFAEYYQNSTPQPGDEEYEPERVYGLQDWINLYKMPTNKISNDALNKFIQDTQISEKELDYHLVELAAFIERWKPKLETNPFRPGEEDIIRQYVYGSPRDHYTHDRQALYVLALMNIRRSELTFVANNASVPCDALSTVALNGSFGVNGSEEAKACGLERGGTIVKKELQERLSPGSSELAKNYWADELETSKAASEALGK